MVKTIGAARKQDLVPGPARRPGMLTVYPLAGRAGLRLEGEADFTVQPQIREALTALPPAAEIHLDLAGLDFIDTGCTRELIALTWQPPHPRLILHDPPPSLLRIIGLLWPEANVEFDPSPARPLTTTAAGRPPSG
jgi:anti-anti-sigma regulatory factor